MSSLRDSSTSSGITGTFGSLWRPSESSFRVTACAVSGPSLPQRGFGALGGCLLLTMARIVYHKNETESSRTSRRSKVQQKQRPNYRPGGCSSRRRDKRRLSRASRHLVRASLRRGDEVLFVCAPGYNKASSDIAYSTSRRQTHNTKPRYKDRHDLGIRGMAVKLAFECNLVARFGGELPWVWVCEWPSW
jgi:hypothetical protein